MELIEKLQKIIEREIDNVPMVLTDPLTLRRLRAERLAQAATAVIQAYGDARADAARREALEGVRRWRDNLKITQGSPIVGDVLHGPALDFVIECLDGLLKENPNAG